MIIIIIMPTCTDNMGKRQNGKNPILNVSFFERTSMFLLMETCVMGENKIRQMLVVVVHRENH